MCILHPCISCRLLKKLDSMRCWLNYLDILGTTANDDILIFEQGLCQCIGALFDDKKIDEATIKKMMDNLLSHQADRIMVYVSIEKDVLIERLKMREDIPFYFRTSDISVAVDRAINTAKLLHDCWRSKYGDQTIITVSNDENNQSNKAAIKVFNTLRKVGSI